MEQCCSSLWGLSWRNASDQTCLSCTYTLLPGQRTCMCIQNACMHLHIKRFFLGVVDAALEWHRSTSSPDSQYSPLVRSSLLGSVRLPQSSATCMSWGGAHYRTFDRKHFHFQGSCTYLLASSTDGTWAVYISTVCDGRGECSKVWKHHRTCPCSFLEKGTFAFQTKWYQCLNVGIWLCVWPAVFRLWGWCWV